MSGREPGYRVGKEDQRAQAWKGKESKGSTRASGSESNDRREPQGSMRSEGQRARGGETTGLRPCDPGGTKPANFTYLVA